MVPKEADANEAEWKTPTTSDEEVESDVDDVEPETDENASRDETVSKPLTKLAKKSLAATASPRPSKTPLREDGEGESDTLQSSFGVASSAGKRIRKPSSRLLQSWTSKQDSSDLFEPPLIVSSVKVRRSSKEIESSIDIGHQTNSKATVPTFKPLKVLQASIGTLDLNSAAKKLDRSDVSAESSRSATPLLAPASDVLQRTEKTTRCECCRAKLRLNNRSEFDSKAFNKQVFGSWVTFLACL